AAISAMIISVHLLRHTDRVLTNGLIKVNRVQASAPTGMKIAAAIIVLSTALMGASNVSAAEEEPARLLPEVVAPAKLFPSLPDAPAGWPQATPVTLPADPGAA